MKNLKKVLIQLSFALTFAFLLVGCDKDDQVVQETELSAPARTYLNTHFNGVAVTRVVRDRDDLVNEYEVVLANGVKLEFTEAGVVTSIKSTTQLPDSVIPANVLAYAKTNYPTAFVTEWELDATDQEIQLSNGLELKFNLAGEFLRIDR
ncbi:MAG: hypothetical protein EOO42_07920 [Flavobacteriales bacterium]|nr:MAG: hypothetical protein EOO42_07920 [Flavobacteriales bacterium]